jgi:hypothetical protein
MSTAVTIADHSELELSDLPSLAGTIQWEFEKSEKAFETALHHGIACGHALLAAKAKVPHGSWMSWIEANTTISHSTVNMFMSLASNSQRVENLETIREALKLLAEDRREARRIVSETYIPYEGEELPPTPSPAPRPAPAPRPSAPRPAPAPVIIEAVILEPEALVMDKCKPKPGVADWVDGNRKAKTGHKQDHLLDALQILPHLTQDQLKSLVETINTRWLR